MRPTSLQRRADTAAATRTTAPMIRVAETGPIGKLKTSEPNHAIHAGTIHPVVTANPKPASGQERSHGKSNTHQAAAPVTKKPSQSPTLRT